MYLPFTEVYAIQRHMKKRTLHVGEIKHHPHGVVASATHGRTGLRRLVLGSVAETVLRELAVPLVLVRPFKAGMNRGAAEDAAGGVHTN